MAVGKAARASHMTLQKLPYSSVIERFFALEMTEQVLPVSITCAKRSVGSVSRYRVSLYEKSHAPFSINAVVQTSTPTWTCEKKRLVYI